MSLEIQDKIGFNAIRKELILTQRDLRTLSDEIVNDFGSTTEYLDLSHNRISNLNLIYAFDNLKYLILDNNRLREAHFDQLKQPLANIRILMLNKNELSDLNTSIALLSRIFPNLEYLSLHGNPICPDGLDLQPFSQYVAYEYDYYRSYIINAFHELKFLDHSPVLKKQFIDTTPVKVNTLPPPPRSRAFSPTIMWAKLKDSIRKKTTVESTNIGNNAEVNRFISNNDL